MPDTRETAGPHSPAPSFRLGLFSRTFALLTILMLVSLVIWLQVFVSVEEGPRATQMAQRVTTVVSITRSALMYAPSNVRSSLLLDLATKESLRVQPLEPTDDLRPLPDSRYWNQVAIQIRERLGARTRIGWEVNDIPGIWVSFELNEDRFWLVFDREQLDTTSSTEWAGWGASALLLALIGAAISVRFVNQPLAQLAAVARQLARGENPSPLPETGPAEIRDMNQAFNRMARDILQTGTDREIMLAGISHDLRTPLARMRLEIEMSQVSETTRHAIDEDLAQIDHSIGQLMEYARPATAIPPRGIDASATMQEVYERERPHTESKGGSLTAQIEPNLYARISANDLKRIVTNLIENARRYGLSQDDDRAHISLRVYQQGSMLVVEVADLGPGIPADDVDRVLRPFSRGELARTGGSGTGLGLAIVDRLISQVDGRFSLLPNSPTGLIARVEIPKTRPRGPGPDATAL